MYLNKVSAYRVPIERVKERVDSGVTRKPQIALHGQRSSLFSLSINEEFFKYRLPLPLQYDCTVPLQSEGQAKTLRAPNTNLKRVLYNYIDGSLNSTEPWRRIL
jgi:hypothetical protein